MTDNQQIIENPAIFIKSFKETSKVFRDAGKYIKFVNENSSEFQENTLPLLQKLNQLEEQIQIMDSHDNVVKTITDFIDSDDLISEIIFDKSIISEKIYVGTSSEKKSIVLSVVTGEVIEYLYFVPNWEGHSAELLNFYIAKIYSIYSYFYRNYSELKELNEVVSLYEDAFSKITIPVALLSNDGELVKHNHLFINLNLSPKICLGLKHNEKVTISGKTYQVFRNDYIQQSVSYIYLAFKTIDLFFNKTSLGPSTEELGIISSSIAHELNNPLAGILSAISLLQLEDCWDQESLELVEEMKKGGKRCKELVEIFLGFSRQSHNDLSSIQLQNELKIENAIDQALNLIRFRMIESGIRLNIQKGKFHIAHLYWGKISLLSMVLYLIFGELMTSYSHYGLISETSRERSREIKGTIFEDKGRIIIEVMEKFDFYKQINNSKLTHYLLDLDGFKLEIQNQQIIIGKVLN